MMPRDGAIIFRDIVGKLEYFAHRVRQMPSLWPIGGWLRCGTVAGLVSPRAATRADPGPLASG